MLALLAPLKMKFDFCIARHCSWRFLRTAHNKPRPYGRDGRERMYPLKVAFISVLLPALLLSGCSASDYGRIMTKEDGTHEILAEGDSQAHADQNALTAAELFCKESGRSGRFVTIHREAAYQGPLADAQQHRTITGLLDVAGALLGAPYSRESSSSSSKTT